MRNNDRQEARTANKVLPKAGLNGFDCTFLLNLNCDISIGR